ncbi:MAG: sirohydrochlorin chelatase [Mycobacteriaceae bacterium]|nr:sirohydrochlorin chelatase [Mycobacteriaceae bacterium]
MNRLVLTAHGSKDPRAAANTQTVAKQLREMRPNLRVDVAYCEQNEPSLVDVLGRCTEDAVVTPLLLANAYHALIDIPAQIARYHRDYRIKQAGVLGEDDRLISVLDERLAELGVSRLDDSLGVLVVAIGSSHPTANAYTATVAPKLAAGTRWAGATTAFATVPGSLLAAADQLRRLGADRLVIASWFLAPGILTDRVSAYAHTAGIAMAAPLGAHPLVVSTVLDRFDQAAAETVAA